MKKTLKIIGLICLVYLSVLTCNTLISKKINDVTTDNLKSYTEKQNATEDVIESIGIMKSRVPIKVPGDMIIYDIKYDQDLNTVFQYYRNNENVDSLKIEDIQNYKVSWKNNTINMMKNNQENKSFVLAEVSFIYQLNDINEKEILTFKINPENYK